MLVSSESSAATFPSWPCSCTGCVTSSSRWMPMSVSPRTVGVRRLNRGVRKMSSIGVVRDLAGFFLPIGYIGASIAVLCAIVALVALARGAAGLAGGAVGCWIVGAMLSLAAGFSGQWWLVATAGAALIAALVLGAVARAVIKRMPARTAPVEVATQTEPAAATRPRAVAFKPASQR